MTPFTSLPAESLLALCIYGEARGEPVEGQAGVAWVVRRRVERRKSTYPGEILKPWQFSCFNVGDPNRARLESMASMPYEDRILVAGFRQCLWVARGVLGDWIADNVKGADHYLALSLFHVNPPSWVDSGKVTVVFGRHVFLNLEG